MKTVELLQQPFDPWQKLADRQNQLIAQKISFGATGIFVGTMRDFNQDSAVQSMFLEHYPGMTEQVLNDLVAQAVRQYALNAAYIVHRIGEITPSQAIVITAAWSAHRAEAFDACRMMIENLKHQAPFWKKETLQNGQTRWVASNTPDRGAPRK